MRCLGLDYGEKRIGLAVAEGMLSIAVPRGEIANEREALKKIATFCRNERVVQLIVGLPLTLAGEEGSMAKAARTFGERLREETQLPVEYVDERFSTKVSHSHGGAAAAILQLWLDRQREEETRNKI